MRPLRDSPQIERTGRLAKFEVRDNVANLPRNVSDVLHHGITFLIEGQVVISDVVLCVCVCVCVCV